MTRKPSLSSPYSTREPDIAPRHLVSARDPRPDDLGHEGFVSNIKGNTTDRGRERVDRGD